MRMECSSPTGEFIARPISFPTSTIRLVDGEQDFGHVKVKAYLKDGLPHMDLEGDLKILHYESGVSPPDLVAASIDSNPADDWVLTEDEEQPVLTASFETDSLGQFGFVWANPVEGVETGGPGTIWVKTAGVLAMLGAVWLWRRRTVDRTVT